MDGVRNPQGSPLMSRTRETARIDHDGERHTTKSRRGREETLD